MQEVFMYQSGELGLLHQSDLYLYFDLADEIRFMWDNRSMSWNDVKVLLIEFGCESLGEL